jgi:hypothetical protein
MKVPPPAMMQNAPRAPLASLSNPRRPRIDAKISPTAPTAAKALNTNELPQKLVENIALFPSEMPSTFWFGALEASGTGASRNRTHGSATDAAIHTLGFPIESAQFALSALLVQKQRSQIHAVKTGCFVWGDFWLATVLGGDSSIIGYWKRYFSLTNMHRRNQLGWQCS